MVSVEEDNKELYATGLKAGEATVTVTMRCGGHTYENRLPVKIIEETEAATNG